MESEQTPKVPNFGATEGEKSFDEKMFEKRELMDAALDKGDFATWRQVIEEMGELIKAEEARILLEKEQAEKNLTEQSVSAEPEMIRITMYLGDMMQELAEKLPKGAKLKSVTLSDGTIIRL